MVCEKCNGTEFSEKIILGATYRQCKNCLETHQVSTSPEYNVHVQELVQEQQEAKKSPTVTCPYCQSTDTKKISGTSRFMSTGIFGLASGKLGKQWHCNKCKSDF